MNEKGTGILKDRETQVEKFVLSKLSTRYRKDNFELFNRFQVPLIMTVSLAHMYKDFFF